MHGKWTHQRNYSSNSRVVAADGANFLTAFGPSRNRRGFMVSVILFNVTASRFVAVAFGEGTPDPATLTGTACLINSVEGSHFFSYEDWGDVIQQQIQVFCNLAGSIYVTEVIDSTPECKCYGN